MFSIPIFPWTSICWSMHQAMKLALANSSTPTGHWSTSNPCPCHVHGYSPPCCYLIVPCPTSSTWTEKMDGLSDNYQSVTWCHVLIVLLGQGAREARATYEAFVSQCDLQAPPVSTGQAGGPEALILGSGDAKSEALSGDEDEDEGDTSPTGQCAECFESVWCYESWFRAWLKLPRHVCHMSCGSFVAIGSLNPFKIY